VIGTAFGVRLAQAQSGDEAAFGCVFRDVQPALLRYLRVMAPEAAEDVAGETWLQVVAGLAGFTVDRQRFCLALPEGNPAHLDFLHDPAYSSTPLSAV